MRRRRRIVAATAICIGIAITALKWFGDSRFRLPARLVTEDVVADLSAAFDRDAVVAEPAADPVRLGVVQPGEPLRGAGPRAVVVAPAGARLRFRVAAPAGAALRLGAGVERPKTRVPAASGVRFSVIVDGRERYHRLVNPAAHHRDQRWFDERIDLGLETGRSVDIVLETAAERADRPPDGTPGWSRIRVVRDTARDRQPASASAPNLLVLLVDTLRADRVGSYGAAPSPTPTLDALAARGLVFENAIAQSSWTLASVASILSGLHPRSHGAVSGEPVRGDDDRTRGELLPDAVVTWPERAAEAGITTVGVSSNPLVSRATNLAQGFETFVEFTWDPTGRNWTSAAEVNRTFLAWLAQNHRYRFVAYLHYMEPHDPYTPPPATRPPAPAGIRPAIAAGWVRDAANKINWDGAPPLASLELDYLRQLYDGEVRAWDAELSRLLDRLGALGVLDSTLVVVTGDHGEEFQEHGMLTHGAHLYQESLRVPLVIAGPGVPAGRRRDVAQGIDIFPTLAAYLGVPVPPALPGRDLLSATPAGAAFSETARGIAPDGKPMDVVSVVMDGWQLIHTPALDRFELYDLDRDPGERNDRYGAADGDALKAVLARWQESAPAAPRVVDHDPTVRDRLRALGYVQ